MVNTTILVVALTIPITIGSIFGILSFMITAGFIGADASFNEVPAPATIPFVEDTGTISPEDAEPEPVPPEVFVVSQEDLISRFLDTIGVKVTETFGIIAQVELIDANMESQIETSRLAIQPLDPREVIIAPTEEIPVERFFINTDFSTQLNDAGTNHHKFSSWDVIKSGNVPIGVITTPNCAGITDNNGLCIRVVGSKFKDDDVHNTCTFYGLSKIIDISDWTREGAMFFRVDYSAIVPTRAHYDVNINGQNFLIPAGTGTFEKEVSGLIADGDNTIRIDFGACSGNPDKFRLDITFNNAQLEGNSVAKRSAIELLQSLTLIQTDGGNILDLGFIEIDLVGVSLFDNERVVLQADLETRIDDKTISQHQVTAFGNTVNKQIALRIDGRDSLVLKLDEQFFDEDTTHNFKLVVNEFQVTVGEGIDSRIFEYHRPFVAYLLDFTVDPNKIVAFNQQNKAIEVFVNDSTLKVCGLTSGGTDEPEVLPPVVEINENGFVIARTVPTAGKFVGEEGTNRQFCSTVPEIPRDSDLLFKINDVFYEKHSPLSQINYFVNCDRTQCTSNVGYSEVFGQ